MKKTKDEKSWGENLVEFMGVIAILAFVGGIVGFAIGAGIHLYFKLFVN